MSNQEKMNNTDMNTISGTKNVGLKDTSEGGESLPLAPAGKPSSVTPSAGTPRNAPKTSRNKKNYEELKQFIPQNNNEENYALLTHYLMMKDSEAKLTKRQELIEKFSFEDSKLSEVEKFFKVKEIPFTSKKDSTFTFIDLFAGIGGFRLAMQKNGGHCVFSSEWDDAAKQTYYENYGEVPFGDITKDETKALIPEHFDVLCAGFPCQAFSIAGKRKGFDDDYKGICRGTLFLEVAEIAEKHRPSCIFCENVKGLTNHDHGRTFKIIKNTFEKVGYTVFEKILNSKDYDVPQNRERIYIVAFRNDLNINNFDFPAPCNRKKCINDIIEKSIPSSKYWLSDVYLETLRRHKARHEAKGNGFGFVIRDRNDVAGTLVCGGMGRERNLIIDNRLSNYVPVTHIKGSINKEGVRKLTPLEWSLIQSFPENFRMPLADTHMYKQFGNSVSVKVIEKISKKICEAIHVEI